MVNFALIAEYGGDEYALDTGLTAADCLAAAGALPRMVEMPGGDYVAATALQLTCAAEPPAALIEAPRDAADAIGALVIGFSIVAAFAIGRATKWERA